MRFWKEAGKSFLAIFYAIYLLPTEHMESYLRERQRKYDRRKAVDGPIATILEIQPDWLSYREVLKYAHKGFGYTPHKVNVELGKLITSGFVIIKRDGEKTLYKWKYEEA